jgi:hypothetical protein
MRVADAQQRGSNSPGADDVAKAYRALIDETKAMWRALGDVVVEAWTGDGAPYASAAEMLADVAGGRLRMRLSDDLFGPGADNPGHPLNAASGVKTVDGRDLSNNDLFRVVHDIYGYGQSGFRDSPRGAYNAYHEHARLVSPEARRALATETLAQSAWANYGQHLRRRDGTVPRETDVDYLKPSLKEFAEQKAFLLSDDVVSADPGWALADAAAGTVEDAPKFSKGFLPSSDSLAVPPAPTLADMQRASRVESVPLSQVRGTQGSMDWARFEKGFHPDVLIRGYADMPVAARKRRTAST